MSGDAALTAAVFLLFLAMMCTGMFQSLWPSEKIKPPKGGKSVLAFVPVERSE